MKILKYPDPFLFKKVKEVLKFDETLKKESLEMIEIMKTSEGVGLAANQVGLDKQIFVMQCTIEKPPYVFINPEIIEVSQENTPYQEGCLSFPNLYIELERSKQVKLKWQDIDGIEQTEDFSGLEAVCVQHELDHLNGIVFVNKLKPAKKQIVLNKYSKLKK